MQQRHSNILDYNLIPLSLLLGAVRGPSSSWYVKLLDATFRLSLVSTPTMGIGLFVDRCKKGDILTIYGGVIVRTDASKPASENWELSLKDFRCADLSIDGKDYANYPWTHWGASVNQAFPVSTANAKIDWIPWDSDCIGGAAKELFQVKVPVIIAKRDIMNEQVLADYGSYAARRMAATAAEAST